MTDWSSLYASRVARIQSSDVREQARALVIGDIVKADVEVTPLDPGYDFPEAAADLAEWCDGKITWQKQDLAVVRALYS